MSNLLIHKRTAEQVKLFLGKPSHALLVTGRRGSGKFYLASHIAQNLLGLKNSSALQNYPYFIPISKPADKQEIPIDAIREILSKLRLKTPGDSPIKRCVIIEDAQIMSTEAQNALLKILEEPPIDTVFILTSPSEKELLPTISSRTQQLNVIPATLKDSKAYFSKTKDSDVESAWNLSEGAVGLMSALVDNSAAHPLKQAVNDVKQLLQQDSYQRIQTLDDIAKNRELLRLFLEAAGRILASLHRTSGSHNTRVLAGRKLVLRLQKKLADNANPRLIALELALKLQV